MAVKRGAHKSIKHDIIEKANTYMFVSISIAVFIVVFCLFAAKALVDHAGYQQKVIQEKKTALKVLKDNKTRADSLKESYANFAGESINILGGNATGNGPRDGDNAKLVLDALPPELDFPALSTSIEKILVDGGYIIQAIGGNDSASADASGDSQGGTTVSGPVEIEFPFSVNASPEAALGLLQTLELSIRPFTVRALEIEGSGNSLDLTIKMNTYYQPSSSLQVSTKVVRP